jgi:hypothetical protein
MLPERTAARAMLAAALLGVACGDPPFRMTVAFRGPLELEAGAEVRYNGVPIGRVEAVELYQPEATDPAAVEVVLAIDDPEVTLREADVFEVVSGTLLDDAHLRVTPSQEPSPPLERGARVAGLPPLVTRVRDSTAETLDLLIDLVKQKRDELLATSEEDDPATSEEDDPTTPEEDAPAPPPR